MYDAEFTMDADGTRAAPGFGNIAVEMPPGTYTVRLTVDGTTLTQPLTVLKDPMSKVPDAEIAASAAALLKLQTELNNTADMLNTIESARAQIQTLAGSNATIKASADSMEQKLLAVEANIIDARMTGQGQDEVRYPVKLGGQIGYLANTIGASDWAPTKQQQDVTVILQKQAKDTRTALEGVLSKDLVAFNAFLKGKGLKTVDVSLPPIVF
jgi:hypothetical protein